jgi:hypothetical protein
MSEWVPIVAAALIIGMLGEVAKKLTGAKPGDKGWRGVYIVTYKAHALAVGACVGLAGHYVGIPVPGVFGDNLGGAVLAYTLAAGVAMVGYASIVGVIKSWIEHAAASSDG